jgi:hypothetical protein
VGQRRRIRYPRLVLEWFRSEAYAQDYSPTRIPSLRPSGSAHLIGEVDAHRPAADDHQPIPRVRVPAQFIVSNDYVFI